MKGVVVMKVLVPVDGSENSMRAASYALKMAKTHSKVEVILLAVACLYSNYDGEAFLNEDKLNVDCQNLFSLRLDDAKNVFADQGVPVNAVLLQGDPADVIIHYAEKNGIDKIVMGSRGLSPLKAAVLGSVTYKVLQNVKIPVTVIK